MAEGVPGHGTLTITVGGEEVRVVVPADRLALGIALVFACMADHRCLAADALPSPVM